MKITIPILIGAPLLFQSSFAGSNIQFQTRLFTVAENVGSTEIPMVRKDAIETEVSCEYYTISGTAIAGEDFTATTGTLTFAAGVTHQTITVQILNDGLIEPLERFLVALTNVTGDAVLGTMRVATISIQDNETPVQLEFGAYWAREDERAVLIGIVRGGDVLDPLTLEIATADGTALAGEDYTATSGALTFKAGQNLKLVTVPILNDGTKEAEETFRVYLTNAPAGMIGTPNTATIRIQDNDPGAKFPQPDPWSGGYWISEDERQVTLVVHRGQDVDLPVQPFSRLASECWRNCDSPGQYPRFHSPLRTCC